MREALFSMLTSRLGSFEGLAVADIFAGSGALGLEALSRGASHCIFVEKDGDALGALRSNIHYLEAEPVAAVLNRPVETLAAISSTVDLVFLDPPYFSGLGGTSLERLTTLGWFSDGCWASIETAQEEAVAAGGWTIVTQRRHGKAKVTLLVRA